MGTINLLYEKEYAVNDDIKIVIPTVGEIVDNEESYYAMISVLTAMPIDMMVQLDDLGIDFTEINEYELFLMTFQSLKDQDTSLVFKDLDVSKFEIAMNEQTNKLVLLDKERDIIIDRAIHGQIAAALRKIHHLEKNIRRPGNIEAKEYMLQRARDKMKRHRNRSQESQLEPLIVALVNTEQFKYDFAGTRELSIYQFNESVRQVIKKVDYDNKMYGIYTGSLSAKDLPKDDLNWLVHK